MVLGWWNKIDNCSSQMVLLQRWVGLGLLFVNKIKTIPMHQITSVTVVTTVLPVLPLLLNFYHFLPVLPFNSFSSDFCKILVILCNLF